LTFNSQPTSDLNGQLSWIKLPLSTARYFSAGFDYVAVAAASAYHAPASPAEHIVGADEASVDFSGGNLPADFSNLISLGLSSRVTNLSSNKLALSFGLANGLYRGTVTDPATGKSRAFRGAVFQKTDTGYGFLLGTNLSSGVVIAP
jgi:hypothetical protein